MARSQWNAFATTFQRDIHIYMHACTEMRTTRMMMMMMMMMMMPMPSSSHPLNLLKSIFGGDEEEGGGGGSSSSIDCRVDVDAAASLMLRVDS